VDICFPGGLRVEALHQGFWIRTDQPVAQGGGGKAPSPFDLFLASLGTCAGFYALRFCQQRNLRTDGLALSLAAERDSERKKVVLVRIDVSLPVEFPEKYRAAIVHAVEQCSVKKHLLHPPAFDITVSGPPVEAPAPPPCAEPVETGAHA
jgi:putative redox protein